MKLSDFDINFNKFKNEQDTVEYQLGDTFFDLKEGSLYRNCDVAVMVVCTKKDSTVTLKYSVTGSISSECERCLTTIKIEINSEFEYPLKLTTNEVLLKEENYISANHQIYNTYDSLYEYICMSIPTRKICENSVSKKECEILHPDATEEEVVDERWAELKKLIKK
jgi:uncharacterized metal-binding protein YceD (DUF177 family)